MDTKKTYLTCDGNHAAAHIAYMFSEVAAIYPITPSSNMAENVDEWSAAGRKNMFGQTVRVEEMQSEAGAAGAVHGALQAGALATTFTASQGLLLMIPNMDKISGELLPGVFHVSARSVAAHALSIFGDHSDVYHTRSSGFAMLCSNSVQEAMDLAGVAHLTAIKNRIPFLHFFDGFRTSHEVQKIEAISTEQMAALVDKEALQRFRDAALNPEHPVTRGTAQNPDIFFQAKEAANKFYEPIPDVVAAYMKEITKITGREYLPFQYYGAPDAENIIIAMGSVIETIKETIDHLTDKGEKVGVISVHLWRPFSAKYLLNVLPKSVKRIAVLDRAKEFGANGEPLYLDIVEVFSRQENKPLIVGGRYGLSSKDTTPSMMMSVYENLKLKEPKNQFSVGIIDDVTFQSLPLLPEIDITPKGTYQAKFFGLGADGTVGANKNSIKIIADTTDKYCQAYFQYDSKKSGGFTVSHLRFGDSLIHSTYYVNTPDFVACHVPAYLEKYDVLKGLKKGGKFLLNSWWDIEETKKRIPDHIKKYLAENEVKFYVINATKIAEEIGLGGRTNTVLQAAFFKVSNVIPFETALDYMKKAVVKTYGSKGEEVVKMNHAAIDRGVEVVEVTVPADWKSLQASDSKKVEKMTGDFIKDVFEPVTYQRGDDVPVSAFVNWEDGTFPMGTSALEKRGIAINIPEWNHETCIQCNQCAYVCPHAVIRPFLLDAKEASSAPSTMPLIEAVPKKQFPDLKFRIQVSPLDCTGCGNCVEVCPSKTKSLTMKVLDTQMVQNDNWDWMIKHVTYKDKIADKSSNVKNSQFAQPLFEFSGACAGCGETPYIKLITQLFGDRMMIANATGCTSIYGGSAPSTPYTTNAEGHGPSWANSLFEDNAEYGFGMHVAVEKHRDRIGNLMKGAMDTVNADTKAAFAEWLENKDNGELSKIASAKVLAALPKETNPVVQDIISLKQYLIKKSQWIFGGDGWAYDIGFGGLDHVLASGKDVNVLVVDTEVYSNTGGQSSKSTPVAAVAKFAAAGKRVRKKDLGMIAMSYGYVYVAQVAMGSSQAQYLKALREAEAYPGPSLIIAYSPCINHGLRNGMGKAQEEQQLAVECGYWSNYRYNPLLEKEGKNPFTLDSKEPDFSKFQDFLSREVRFTSLKKSFPAEAGELFIAAEENAKWRHGRYKILADVKYENDQVKA